MTPFRYEAALDTPGAVTLGAALGAKYLGGGTNLVDLMRETIERPDVLVDISGLAGEITDDDAGGLIIGAGVKNTAVAADRRVRERFPLLAQSILSGASGQIRNMATVGGNIMQRTRCLYFFDDAARCNKREQGAGCYALEGFNRNHAIMGASPACVATHPSDMCVALAALGATVRVEGSGGAREIPIVDFHCLPGETPHIETILRPGDLITAVVLPPLPFARNSTYRKVRDRASYAFALVSVAAALQMDGGRITDVRIAFGGIAPKPWRASKAEAALRNGPATEQAFQAAATAELADAKPLRENSFKVELASRALIAVLGHLAGAAG
jgi:xanthine dehydrogenase YagS FAD-binding subunit